MTQQELQPAGDEPLFQTARREKIESITGLNARFWGDQKPGILGNISQAISLFDLGKCTNYEKTVYTERNNILYPENWDYIDLPPRYIVNGLLARNPRLNEAVTNLAAEKGVDPSCVFEAVVKTHAILDAFGKLEKLAERDAALGKTVYMVASMEMDDPTKVVRVTKAYNRGLTVSGVGMTGAIEYYFEYGDQKFVMHSLVSVVRLQELDFDRLFSWMLFFAVHAQQDREQPIAAEEPAVSVDSGNASGDIIFPS